MEINRINIGDEQYLVDEKNERATQLLSQTREIDARLIEATNMMALLTKAKNAYISELKQEMLSSKAGLGLID